jgi:hypothetical protein
MLRPEVVLEGGAMLGGTIRSVGRDAAQADARVDGRRLACRRSHALSTLSHSSRRHPTLASTYVGNLYRRRCQGAQPLVPQHRLRSIDDVNAPASRRP